MPLELDLPLFGPMGPKKDIRFMAGEKGGGRRFYETASEVKPVMSIPKACLYSARIASHFKHGWA
jgi:hypothetical protein